MASDGLASLPRKGQDKAGTSGSGSMEACTSPSSHCPAPGRDAHPPVLSAAPLTHAFPGALALPAGSACPPSASSPPPPREGLLPWFPCRLCWLLTHSHVLRSVLSLIWPALCSHLSVSCILFISWLRTLQESILVC